MALPNWPVVPHSWLDDWLIWRLKGSPSPRPANIPPDLGLQAYRYTQEVLAWVIWNRKGKPDPRPNVTPNIPDWAYPLVKQCNQAVPIALPDQPHSWLLALAISRFKNEPRPPSVPENYSTRYPYVWSFLRWCGWRRKGAPLPKPINVPQRVPEPYWYLYEQLKQAVPIVPPTPPPPPPPQWENSWKLPSPLMFTTWGFMASQWTVESIGQRMFDAGVKTVCLQIGQFSPDVPERLRAFGFKIALWGIPSGDDAQELLDANADGYMPQIEGPSQAINAINNLKSGVGAGLSLSTVTTLAGLETFVTLPSGQGSTFEVEELKAAGCTHAWLECYKQDPNDVHFPISKMVGEANRRGFPYKNPLVGLYWDVPLSTYEPDISNWGKQVGAYTAETMRYPVDWIDFKNL